MLQRLTFAWSQKKLCHVFRRQNLKSSLSDFLHVWSTFDVLVQFAKTLPKSPIKKNNFFNCCLQVRLFVKKLPSEQTSILELIGHVKVLSVFGLKYWKQRHKMRPSWHCSNIANPRQHATHSAVKSFWKCFLVYCIWWEKKYREVFCERTFRKKFTSVLRKILSFEVLLVPRSATKLKFV